MRRGFGLLMLLMLPVALESSSTSPPGKPVLVGCRCPDKETFTCWWDPGSDGGLPTVHRLYYKKENVKETYECPDYRTAGKNSCFFNQTYTNLWEEYTLRVVAFNALGNTSSDSLEIDVMKILKPDAVENVTVLLNDSINTPFLNIIWTSPLKTSKSGWVTLNYELRFKQEDSPNWKTVSDIKENVFKLYNLDPGTLYMVQVRSNIDHSTWSEWSNTTVVKIPNQFQETGKTFWILVFVFSIIPLLAAICIVFLKRKLLKQLLLPPVPGPKIRGVDVQLLKSGRSKDVVSALTANQNFPPMVMWMEQTEEFLIMSDSSDWLLADSYKSHKNDKNLLISAGSHVDSEIRHEESSPGHCDSDKNEVSMDETGHFGTLTKSQSKDKLSKVELLQLPAEKQQSPGVNFVNIDGTLQQEATPEKTSQPVAVTGYVDIQQKNTPEADVTQWDYSRVKEVNGETILILKNENLSVSPDIQGQEGNMEENVPSEYSRVKEVNSDMVFLQKCDSSDCLCKKKGDHNAERTNQKSKMPHMNDCNKAMFLQTICNGYVDSVPKFSAE